MIGIRSITSPATALGALLLGLSGVVSASDWFVAPDGDDAAVGSLEQPFATIQRAQKEVSPGDSVYLRGGVYKMEESQIARRRGIFAYLTVLDKSGTKSAPITYQNYEGERPE